MTTVELTDDEVRLVSTMLQHIDVEISDGMAALRNINDRSGYGRLSLERRQVRALRAKIDVSAPAAS